MIIQAILFTFLKELINAAILQITNMEKICACKMTPGIATGKHIKIWGKIRIHGTAVRLVICTIWECDQMMLPYRQRLPAQGKT